VFAEVTEPPEAGRYITVSEDINNVRRDEHEQEMPFLPHEKQFVFVHPLVTGTITNCASVGCAVDYLVLLTLGPRLPTQQPQGCQRLLKDYHRGYRKLEWVSTCTDD